MVLKLQPQHLQGQIPSELPIAMVYQHSMVSID